MSAAESYYQQLYCEVKARGAGAALPSFADFQRNDPTVQALLLKRPARSLGIEVAMPRKPADTAITRVETAPGRVDDPSPRDRSQAPAPAKSAASSSVADAAQARHCELAPRVIRCDARRYRLLGNQRNDRLASGALSARNRMELPVYRASLSDSTALNRYLSRAYRRYIEKMLDIGLGGATMSYGKFTGLFRDLAAKGVDFARRFEIMYRFLKKDKHTLAVSERVRMGRAPGLSDCGNVSERLIVCSVSDRNYVYRRVD